MNQQSRADAKDMHYRPSIPVRVVLILGLVIISIFPIFVTFAPREWPPQPMALLIDAVYLLIVAGYVAVLTGRSHSKWLVTTVAIISIIGIASTAWLTITLATLHVSW